MKTKDVVFLTIMILLFAITTGMFFYQNFYIAPGASKNQVTVLIAKKDILPGMAINKDNTISARVDRSVLTGDIVTANDKIPEPIASEKIYKGEYISKKRLAANSGFKNGESTYILNLEPDYASNVKEGDLVKIYMQTSSRDGSQVKNYLVCDRKEVLNVIKDDKNKGSNILQIRVTDEEALAYYNAKKKGQIIALKYDDVATSNIAIPKIRIEVGSNGQQI